MHSQLPSNRIPSLVWKLKTRPGLPKAPLWNHRAAVFLSTSPRTDDRAAIKTEDALKETAVATPNHKFDLNSIFVLSIPITTQRSFIYCHHKTSLLTGKQLQNVPWLVKSEAKLVEYATKAWNKLAASELSINKKIVKFIERLLGTIPYDESSLRSFPSKSTMIRETRASEKESLPRAVMTGDLQNEEIEPDQLKSIPVYHPRFQKPAALLSQMQRFQEASLPYHKKWAVLCAIGIPITLPVALLPVAPNVPGFYLTYRLYCHIQALRGANNLGHLIDAKATESATSNLSFQEIEELDSSFISSAMATGNETLVVNSESIDKIVGITGLEEMREDLTRAYKQEEKRLLRKNELSDQGPS